MAGGRAKWCGPFGQQFGSFLRERDMELLYDPAVPLLRICPKEGKARVHHKLGPGFLLGMMKITQVRMHLSVNTLKIIPL